MAIQNLGLLNQPGARESGKEALLSIYNADSSGENPARRRGRALMQPNARALVDLARPEKEPSLKRRSFQALVMRTPEATDYVLEMLK